MGNSNTSTFEHGLRFAGFLCAFSPYVLMEIKSPVIRIPLSITSFLIIWTSLFYPYTTPKLGKDKDFLPPSNSSEDEKKEY
jgi:hypothetical protein